MCRKALIIVWEGKTEASPKNLLPWRKNYVSSLVTLHFALALQMEPTCIIDTTELVLYIIKNYFCYRIGEIRAVAQVRDRIRLRGRMVL